LQRLAENHSGLLGALNVAEARIGGIKAKREVAPYQAAALYALAQEYDGGNILEIGTARGYSAAVMAQAAFRASIVTLNPVVDEADVARGNLAAFNNVKVLTIKSWDYLATYDGPELDMIFVDGDHARIVHDLPWFNWLVSGGLIVFHDYAPDGTYRAVPPVFEALNRFAAYIERDFDVSVIDDGGVGLVGWRKQNGEMYFGEF